MRQNIEQDGLYYPDGTYKSRDQIIIDSFNSPKIEYNRPFNFKSDEWFKEAQRRQEAREKTEDTYNFARIEIERDRPAFVGITGDWHLGQKINHSMLKRDTDIIAEHPLVVGAFLMGDLTDSANFNPAQDEDILSFQEQQDMMISILDKIGKDRILAMWKGNHDFKWESKGGVNKYHGLSEKYEAPVFYGNSFVEFVINGIPINMIGSHRLRGSSTYNNSHPIVRVHREIQNLDFAFCGHTHRKGKIEQPTKVFNGAKVIGGVVCGTYQISSGYGKDNGFGDLYDPEQGMWWLKIAHDEKNIQVYSTDEMLKEAKLYM